MVWVVRIEYYLVTLVVIIALLFRHLSRSLRVVRWSPVFGRILAVFDVKINLGE